jgi:hypothetical protein
MSKFVNFGRVPYSYRFIRRPRMGCTVIPEMDGMFLMFISWDLQTTTMIYDFHNLSEWRARVTDYLRSRTTKQE